MKQIDDPLLFRFFTEIGIIGQLASSQLERGLPDGLKLSQFGVLNHLVRLGGAWSPARLANAFQVTKGAMTNTLTRLESRNLVDIKPDPADGRAKLVTITDAGKSMRERCLESIVPLLTNLSHEIPEKDIIQVLPTLEMIRKYLDTHRS